MKKLTINSLQNKINNDNLNNITGGAESRCSCACAYANQGGSSTCDNSAENYKYGLHSPGYPDGCSVGLTLEEHQFFLGCY